MNKCFLAWFLALCISPCQWSASAADPLAKHFIDADFTSLVFGELRKANGNEVISVQIPAWSLSWGKETETYTEIVPELRTRAIEEDGKTILETYTVEIPVVRTREVDTPVWKAKTPIKAELKLEDFKVWKVGGRLLSVEETRQALKSPAYMFILNKLPANGVPAMDPFYANAFRQDMLIVYNERLTQLCFESIEETPPPLALEEDSGT